MNAQIEKIFYYLPKIVVSNTDLESEFPEWNSQKIEDKVGIKERHIAGEDETALDLGIIAANALLRDIDRSKIDFLMLCTQSPDYFLPTSACIMQDKLGLNTEIGAFDFNLGCSGYIYGLALAKGLIQGGIAENILLVMSETYSKHIHKKDKANRTIFGDGAAATIVSRTEVQKIHEFVLGTNGGGMYNLIVPNGGMRNKIDENCEEQMDDSGNISSKNNLYMNGAEIFNFTIENVPITVANCLKKNNMGMDDIDFIIFHQANKYILNHLRRKMGIPKEKFFNNMIHTGNTVSATIPIALKDSMDQNLVKAGDKALLVGFGVGYSWGATIITI